MLNPVPFDSRCPNLPICITSTIKKKKKVWNSQHSFLCITLYVHRIIIGAAEESMQVQIKKDPGMWRRSKRLKGEWKKMRWRRGRWQKREGWGGRVRRREEIKLSHKHLVHGLPSPRTFCVTRMMSGGRVDKRQQLWGNLPLIIAAKRSSEPQTELPKWHCADSMCVYARVCMCACGVHNIFFLCCQWFATFFFF